MKILALPKYHRNGPSSRLRFFQFIPYLESAGITVEVQPLLGRRYIRKLYASGRKPFSTLIAGYLNRIRILFNLKEIDLIWIEKELFPWIPGLDMWFLEKARKPFVVDFDDAVFHLYDQHSKKIVRTKIGTKIDRIMGGATVVTAGNPYIAERARRAGADLIETIPTVVDMSRYKMRRAIEQPFTVGWIGSPVTQKYLHQIDNTLKTVASAGSFQLVLVGASESALAGLNPLRVAWTEETEVQSIHRFDVGIMPLQDSAFERGKCGYKLIQCMACGIPVVASPVGVNTQIVEHGVDGFLAETEGEWITHLNTLRDNKKLRDEMGFRARSKIMRRYSLEHAAPLLHDILVKAAKA
jgi:glycosyltransferase involved in cell wall biosynthesis